MELQIKIENPSAIQKKIIVSIPAQSVNTKLEKGFVEVQKTAKIKGFRPGHVPLSLVKQYYGSDVRHQVYRNLIDESYQQAIRTHKIRAVGSPKIDTGHSENDNHVHGPDCNHEHEHAVVEGKELKFTAIVDVIPEIAVKGYEGISLKQEKVEVKADDVEKVIKNILDAHAELITIENPKAASKGDHVDITFDGGIAVAGGIEKKEGMKGSRVIEIGSGSLIEGFEDQMIGMKKGETKTIKVKFPADFFEAELAGKDAEFVVTLNEIKEKKLPVLDDEFVKGVGYESVADLKAKTEKQLTEEKTRDSDRKLRSDLIEALIEKNQFEVPESLISAQMRVLIQDASQNLKAQGYTEEMISQAVLSELEPLKKRADAQVRASLILESIAEAEKIAVTPEDIEAEMKNMSQQMKVELSRVTEYYKDSRRKADLEFRLKEEKTMKHLLGLAKIKK